MAVLLNEGILVRLKGDSTSLEGAFKRGGLASTAFAAVAVAAIAAVTVQSVKMAASLDHDLRLVATLYNGTTKDIEAMRQSVKALSREFGIQQQQLAKANYQVVSAGFKGLNKEMDIMRAGARLAVVGNADLVGSTEAVAKAIKAFGLEAKDADKAAAQLWGITRDGIITVEGLNRFLKDLPATAAATGLSFEGLSATISTLTGITGSAERSMDQLRSILIKTANLGMSGDIGGRVSQLRDMTGGDLGRLTKLLGDQTAAVGAQLLISYYDTLTTNIGRAATVQQDFNDGVDLMMDGPMKKWNQVQQEMNAGLQELGVSILPAVTSALGALAEALKPIVSFLEWDAGNWEKFKQLVGDYAYVPGGGAQPTGGLVNTMKPGQVVPTTGFYGPPPPAPTPTVTIPGGGSRYYQGDAFPAAGSVPRHGLYPGQQGPQDYYNANRGMAEPLPGSIDLELPGNLAELADESERSAFAVGAANIAMAGMAGLVGGALISAFGRADSAMGAFIQSMLIQFAQLGTKALMSSLFPGLGLLGGFQSGGFTGVGNPNAIAGTVHGGEFVFSKAAVDAIGRNRLDSMHQQAQGGSTYNITTNVGGGRDPNTTARAVNRSVSAAIRQASRTGVADLHASPNLG